MTQQERTQALAYTPAPDLLQFLGETHPPGYGVIYVASPYWHQNPSVRRARADAAQAVTSGMILRGEPVFSPIVYSASIQERGGVRPAQGWYEFDLNFLAVARSMTVLEIPGWEQSRGILIELGFARARGIPLERMDWDRINPLLDDDTRRTLLEI